VGVGLDLDRLALDHPDWFPPKPWRCRWYCLSAFPGSGAPRGDGEFAVVTYPQFLLAAAGGLFVAGLLILLLVNRLETSAARAAVKEAHRLLRARLGA